MWPRVSSAYPSRSRVAAWPHWRVRGTPDLRHHKVRTPYKPGSPYTLYAVKPVVWGCDKVDRVRE
eukprot:656706-Prymnesium_polylepis.1